MTDVITESLSWGHPVAWGVYIYTFLSLGLALGLLWLRRQILHPQRDELLVQAAEVQVQLSQAHEQLVQINRQADRGLDQLEALLNLTQGLFLALLETRLVEVAMARLRKRPIWIRLLTRKGLETAIAQADAAVRTHHIKDRDEAAYE